jgi:hypothetical protein
MHHTDARKTFEYACIMAGLEVRQSEHESIAYGKEHPLHRLVWDPSTHTLTMYTSHGPHEGPMSWLDTYKEQCPDGLVPKTGHALGMDFASTVDYWITQL